MYKHHYLKTLHKPEKSSILDVTGGLNPIFLGIANIP